MPADRLAQLLDAELSAGVDELDFEAPTVLPALTRAERTELAELIGGSADKGSRPYKAARRNVERWEKGRRPTPASVLRLVGARRQQGQRVALYRQRGAEVRLTFHFYETRRVETRPGARRLHIPREAMRQVAREWSAGNPELAAGRLFDAFLVQYGVPNPDDWAREVIVVGLDMHPSG